MNLKNQVAVITGGAGGIGKCITEHFLNAGAYVAIIDTDFETGTALSARYPDRLFFFHGDVSREEDLRAFSDAVLKRHAQVNHLIHNAMKSQGGILSGCDYEHFVHAMKVGVAAPYYLTLCFKNHFAPHACVVNLSSTRSAQSQPDTESYSAAKGGIASLTHALSVSLAGIARVNAIAPGWIETDPCAVHSDADRLQHPVRRVGTPEDIAQLTLFLCSESSGFINGQEIAADGGMSKQMIYHNDNGWNFTPPERR